MLTSAKILSPQANSDGILPRSMRSEQQSGQFKLYQDLSRTARTALTSHSRVKWHFAAHCWIPFSHAHLETFYWGICQGFSPVSEIPEVGRNARPAVYGPLQQPPNTNLTWRTDMYCCNKKVMLRNRSAPVTLVTPSAREGNVFSYIKSPFNYLQQSCPHCSLFLQKWLHCLLPESWLKFSFKPLSEKETIVIIKVKL